MPRKHHRKYLSPTTSGQKEGVIMRKANLFNAEKRMSERVENFMYCNVWKAVINDRYNAESEKIKAKLSFQFDVFAKASIDEREPIQEKINVLQNELATLADKKKDQLERGFTFEYTQNDSNFYGMYKAAEDTLGIRKAIRQWFAAYALVDIEGTTLENDILSAIKGEKAANGRTIIKSGATQFTQKRSKGDVLKVFYGKLAEHMLAAGTLKAQEIPEDVKKAYAKKGKKSKKVVAEK